MSEANQLGELLVTRQLLSREQLASALDEQLRTRKSLGRVLIDQQLVTESDLVATLAAQIGLDFIDLGRRRLRGLHGRMRLFEVVWWQMAGRPR